MDATVYVWFWPRNQTDTVAIRSNRDILNLYAEILNIFETIVLLPKAAKDKHSFGKTSNCEKQALFEKAELGTGDNCCDNLTPKISCLSHYY